MGWETVHHALGSEGLPGWRTVKYGPYVGVDMPGGVNAGPWWVDPNHAPPAGAGYLHLLAYAYRVGAGDTTAKPPQVGVLPAIDMAGARVTARVGASALRMPRHAKIGFWIQAYDPLGHAGAGAYYNLFNITRLICDDLGAARPLFRNADLLLAGAPRDVAITLSANPRHWVSLGGSKERARTYAHIDEPKSEAIAWVLANWVDFGFIMLLDGKYEPLADGQIIFEEIRVERPVA